MTQRGRERLKLAVADDRLPFDEEVPHRAGVAKHKRGHRIGFRAAVVQVVDGEEGDVGPLSDLDGPDVIATQARGPAAGGDPQGLARRHGYGTLPCPGGEQGLARLGEQIAAVV